MNERTRNVAVGLTALVGLIGLATMLVLFGYLPEWLESGYRVRIVLPHAAGLSEGSRVNLSGIDIGSVDAVQLQPRPGKGVVVTTRIHEDVRIPENATASVFVPLLGGSPTVEFHVAGTDGPIEGYLPTTGEAVVEGHIASPASELTRELQSTLTQPMQQFDEFAAEFSRISGEWQRVGENINRLLEPRSPAAVKAGEAEPNLTTVIARADARLTELEEALAGINGYVNDPALHSDIRTTAANARALSETLSTRVDDLSQTLNSSVQTLRSRYMAVADDLSGVVSSMQAIADRTEAGEGTLGRLTRDPELYENLNDAVERTKAAIDELRLLIQKWKAEGVPVQL